MKFFEIRHANYRVGIFWQTSDLLSERGLKSLREKSGEKELIKLMFPPDGRNWEYLPSGKPFFPASETDLSLSHSENITACQVSGSLRCGIDIQHFREKIIRVKEKFLNRRELSFINLTPLHEQTPILTVMWSCKEALFKMYGEGFIDYLNLFTVLPFSLTDSIVIANADLGDGLRDYYFRLFVTASFVLVFHHGLPKLTPDDITNLPDI